MSHMSRMAHMTHMAWPVATNQPGWCNSSQDTRDDASPGGGGICQKAWTLSQGGRGEWLPAQTDNLGRGGVKIPPETSTIDTKSTGNYRQNRETAETPISALSAERGWGSEQTKSEELDL